MTKAIFYHAGCPVCVNAEEELLQLVDPKKASVTIVHLGEEPDKIVQAEASGVASVPALVLENGAVLHINYGAGMADLKKLTFFDPIS